MATLGLGVIGLGWVAGEHIRAYQRNPHTEVVALGTRDPAHGHEVAARHGLQDYRVYTRIEDLVADPRVDIVAVCTPNCLHVEPVVRAAEAGKHLDIEKPVACDLASLQRMRDAVRRAGVRTVVSFVLRWNPLCQTIRALIADGALGRLLTAEVSYWNATRNWATPGHWIYDRALAGSTMLTGGCHAVDALRSFVADEAVEVTAYSTQAQPDYPYPTTTVALVRFRGGTIGKVSACVEANLPYTFKIALLGDRGTILDNRLWSHKFPGQTDFVTIPTVLPDTADVAHHPFQGQIDEFVAAIQGGHETQVNLEDAVKTHEIVLAADLSATEGGAVRLPLLPP